MVSGLPAHSTVAARGMEVGFSPWDAARSWQFNLVGSLTVVLLGLGPALVLAYAADLAYLAMVVPLSRRRHRW